MDIVEEGFDIALRIGHLKSSSLIAKRIAPIRLVMCASPDYVAQRGEPACPEDLKEHRYLRYSYMDQEASPSIHKWLQSANYSDSGELASNNGDVLVEAAIAGAGIVLQPTFIVGAALRDGKLQMLLPNHEPEAMTLYAVYAHRQLLASKVRSFIDFISDYFGEPPYWDQFVQKN